MMRSAAGAMMLATASAMTDLEIVDAWLDAQPRNVFGLIRTYEDNYRYDVYDNAVAAIYYTERGQYTKAKGILDAFEHYMYPNGSIGATTPEMMAAAYLPEGGEISWDSEATAKDLGNNAWAGLAFAKYAAATQSDCEGKVAKDHLDSLTSQFACTDQSRGFMGRVGRNYRSIEHNIDMFGFCRAMDATYYQASASQFIESMWGHHKENIYAVGTADGVPCDTTVNRGLVAVDSVTWNIAADADRFTSHKQMALEFALTADGEWVDAEIDSVGNDGTGVGETYSGLRFSTAGTGIHWENTAGGLVAMQHYLELNGDSSTMNLSDKIQKVSSSLSKLLQVYGAIPASIREEGSDTGMGWSYFRSNHLAATAWSGLALMGKNPYSKPERTVPQHGTCSTTDSVIV
jgi:hypothetical protein